MPMKLKMEQKTQPKPMQQMQVTVPAGIGPGMRVMRYSAPAEASSSTGKASGEETQQLYEGDGDFPTDPRNAHHDGRNRRPAGDSFLIESSTIVTQKKAGEGATVTRTQRRRSVRSTSNPGGRVETQTVVRRTSVDDGGNIVV